LTFYRHDLAGQTLKNPHTFFSRNDDAGMRNIALASQAQFAIFFQSEGAIVVDPDELMTSAPAVPLFETPLVGPPPEDLGFIP
jgi:hypothetical protein